MKWTVYKFNPATDAKPYYVTGEVPYTKDMSALHALKYFNENIEHVNYDYSCRGRLCGRCAMLLNGEPTLICTKRLEDQDYTIEPLPGYPVIRDLIVDKKTLDDNLTAIYNRIRVEPFNAETIKADRSKYPDDMMWETYGAEFCARCGVCNVSCPAMAAHPGEYIGPAGMLAIAYRYMDPLDQGDRVMQAVSGGLYHCIMCGKCDEVCAHHDIKHLNAWNRLREAAEERGIVPSYAK